MPRKWLIAFGVLTWSAATIASGLAGSFLGADRRAGRRRSGGSELRHPRADDHRRRHAARAKGKTLAIFFLAVPLGSALGFVLGGILQDCGAGARRSSSPADPASRSRCSACVIAEPTRNLSAAKVECSDSLKTLARIPLYRRAVLGYCAHTAAIGAFAHWAPTFLYTQYGLALKPASLWFGAVTVVAGAIGTILGGRWADRALARLPPVPGGAPHDHRPTASRSTRSCASAPSASRSRSRSPRSCFLMPTAIPFFVFVGLAQVGLFLSTSPINAILLRTVTVFLRASAMAAGDLRDPPAGRSVVAAGRRPARRPHADGARDDGAAAGVPARHRDVVAPEARGDLASIALQSSSNM